MKTYIDHFPKEFHIEYPELIFDQGEGVMCSPCSISLIRYIQNYKRHGIKDKIIDPVYLYGNRNIDMYQGEGIDAKDILIMLRQEGVYYQSIKEYQNVFINLEGNLCSYEQCEEYVYRKKLKIDYSKPEIKDFSSVHTINEIKCAVMNFCAVTARIPFFKNIKQLDNRNRKYYIESDLNYKKIQNNNFHQVTIIGWIDYYWKIQNSYGKDYGDHGIAYLSMEYPITSAWTIVDIDESETFGIIM